MHTFGGMHSSTANNTYRFASCRQIRAKARRAAGQELFAERGWEGIQSPPQSSLTCAQVRAGAGPRVLYCQCQTSELVYLGGRAGKADFTHTSFFFFCPLTVAVVNEVALAVFVSLVFAAWGNARVQVFLA